MLTEYRKPFERTGSWLPRHNSPGLAKAANPMVAATLKTRAAHWIKVNYTILRVADGQPGPGFQKLPPEFQPTPFPLNDAEWKQHIERR